MLVFGGVNVFPELVRGFPKLLFNGFFFRAGIFGFGHYSLQYASINFGAWAMVPSAL